MQLLENEYKLALLTHYTSHRATLASIQLALGVCAHAHTIKVSSLLNFHSFFFSVFLIDTPPHAHTGGRRRRVQQHDAVGRRARKGATRTHYKQTRVLIHTQKNDSTKVFDTSNARQCRDARARLWRLRPRVTNAQNIRKLSNHVEPSWARTAEEERQERVRHTRTQTRVTPRHVRGSVGAVRVRVCASLFFNIMATPPHARGDENNELH